MPPSIPLPIPQPASHIYTLLISVYFFIFAPPALHFPLPFLSFLFCSPSVLPFLFLICSLPFPDPPLHWKPLLGKGVSGGPLEVHKHWHCPWAHRTCVLTRGSPRRPMRSFLSDGPAFRKEGSEISAIHVLGSVGVSLSHQTVLSASLHDLQTILAPL